MKRALFIGSITDIFAGQLSIELKKEGWIVDAIVGHRNTLFYSRLKTQFHKIWNPFCVIQGRAFLNPIQFLLLLYKTRSFGRYDVVHFHYAANPFVFLFAVLIHGRARKVLTVYGTDFYRASSWQRKLQAWLLPKFDVVTFANEQTREDLIKALEPSPKMRERFVISHFGLRVLDSLKEKLELRKIENREAPYLLAIGYNGDPGQRHLEVIEQLSRLPLATRAKIKVLLQLSYGLPSDDYKKSLCEALRLAGLEFQLVDKFQSQEDLARLRYLTDIMIQVQPSDQLSGSMQEVLYLDTVVITGSWLPYERLKKLNVRFIEVNTLSELTSRVQEVVDNFQEISAKIKGNSEAIFQLSSWENCRREWLAAYNKESLQ